MVTCLERGADLHTAQLMPLPLTVCCFTKIQIDVTFLVPADLGSPGKMAVKRVCFQCFSAVALLFCFEPQQFSCCAWCRYVRQFREIFTEEGRRQVKITHQVPGRAPVVTYTQVCNMAPMATTKSMSSSSATQPTTSAAQVDAYAPIITIVTLPTIGEQGIVMSISVCVFVSPRSYLRNYTSDQHQFFVHVTYDHGSVLLCNDTLCTSSLMDDVILSQDCFKHSAHTALVLAINCVQ